MPRVLPAAFLAVALSVGATAANAATFLTFAPPAPNGSISGTFGNNGITTPDFTDIFDFMLPVAGTTSVTFSTIGLGVTDITFTSATFNGAPLALSGPGIFEFGSLFNAATAAGPQQLVISGTSGGLGSYSGTISFDVAVIPEPASWAMMIAGFGGVGALMRRRRADQTAA